MHYTSPMKPNFLCIGLGNPGKQYERTRHNLGFLAVDHAASLLQGSPWKEVPRFRSLISETEIEGISCFLVKPITFMNCSGEAIRSIVDFYHMDPATQILVCCDDIDLPLGTNRLRMSGSAGTHNGLKSIVDCIGEQFPRLRIGLGPKPQEIDLAAWVLSSMNDEEKEKLQPSIQYLLTAMKEVLKNSKK